MQMSTTIRVTDEARQRIARLAAEDERPMTAIVDDALDALERRRFFEQYNRRYAELADDEAAWAEIVDERTVEAGAIADGR
jgi:predicted transcriptional regulator